MSIDAQVPDYDLADTLELTTPAQVRALSDELRRTILLLLHERAATVTELAAAVERPKSTVAHHVKVLTEAGLLRVVRTRRVRAIEERYYGRTARMYYARAGERPGGELPLDFNDFEVAAKESAAAYEARELQAFIRRARISADQAKEFGRRIRALVTEFDNLPRSGETTYGFAIGLYPMPGHPTLPAEAGEAD